MKRRKTIDNMKKIQGYLEKMENVEVIGTNTNRKYKLKTKLSDGTLWEVRTAL